MRSVITSLLVVAGAFVGGVACGDDADGPVGPREHGGDDIGGQIVATVDGVGIRISEVEAVVRRTGCSPREALTRLEERELLAAEARRRGMAEDRTTDIAVARAMVQRFLVERVEEVVTPESITDEAMRARYQEWSDRYIVPVRRRSIHLLFQTDNHTPPEDVARAEQEARAVLARARAGDAEAVLDAASSEGPRRVLERLPPFPREGALEEPYAEALYVTPPGSVHPEVVQTSYGFHVVLVTEELPEEITTFEEASDEMREALVLEGRAQLLSRMLQEAAAERSVEVVDPAVARISSLELGT